MAFPPSNSAVESKAPRALLSVVLGFLIITATPSPASTRDFHVPQDTALQIRLDDTLTSVDSQIGNPFSATVVDTAEYRNARMYGHIAGIHMSGKVKGSTSMVLRFDRLVMADGRRAPIHAEIVELYHAPSGEKVDVEGAIESGGRGGRPSRIPLSEEEPVPCWAESSVGQGSRDWVNCRRCARTRHYRIPWP